jgi:hypothetical protein
LLGSSATSLLRVFSAIYASIRPVRATV